LKSGTKITGPICYENIITGLYYSLCLPEPPGGISGLLKYIADNTRYPAVPQENNIQGTVIVKFCVTSKGGIDQVSILRPVDPDLDAEAIRVVKTLPTFRPGKQGGVPVPVWFTVPIKFQIKTTP